MAKMSLQEQMMKAGLVNQKKLKKAKKGSKKSRELAREVKASVEEKKQNEAEKARILNQQQQEEKHKKEIKAQVKQLIGANKLDLKGGDIKYNFTDGTLIKFVYVNSLFRQQLLNGLLSIARFEESYVVIPSIVAKKVAMRDADAIVETQVAEEEIAEEDDPYADYVVPDDLMW